MTGFIRSSFLGTIKWLEHGFGQRFSTPPHELATLKQIHSDVVLVADQPNTCAGEGDALITDQSGTLISIRTADCLPILLADTRRHAVAAVHAGWRGTAAHIMERTIEKMRSKFGTDPADVVAAIGPGIGVCCYEVGEEVARKFGFDRAAHLDLSHENRKQLAAAGVISENIEALGICTFCNAERFYSYRRDKESAGRQISFIGITRRA